MTQEAENFRRNVAAACDVHGSKQELADNAGISNVYLSKIIHGKATPTIDVASKIAGALGVPLGKLLKSPPNLAATA